MRRVLFVSKPIAPPFSDGTRNLVRDLARALPTRAEVLTPRGQPLDGVRSREIYGPQPPPHSLSRRDAARLMALLALGALPPLLHWFFTPAASTASLPSRIARLRGRRTVWTLPSAPTAPLRARDVAHVDQLMVFSQATRERLVGWGIDGARVRVVRPWLTPLALPSASRIDATRARLELRERMTLFCGDLGPGRGDTLTLEAFAEARREGDVLVLAARPKGAHAASARRALLARIEALGIRHAVRVVDFVEDMPALLALADLVALPATVLDAKVDVPLVLLEALSLGKAVVVAEGSPPADLALRGGARAVPASIASLAGAFSELLRSPDARGQLGEAGRALVLRDHAASALAQTHEALYDGLSP